MNANKKASCPVTYEEPCEDPVNRKPGQIIDADGCLVWSCVPKQPYCCERESLVAVVCSSEEELVQILDSKTNCRLWTCAPKQPYCCERSEPRQCEENSYSVEVYDQKTGCLTWTCAPCPYFDWLEGMSMCCLIGTPCMQKNSLGCPQWGCCSLYPVESVDVSISK